MSSQTTVTIEEAVNRGPPNAQNTGRRGRPWPQLARVANAAPSWSTSITCIRGGCHRRPYDRGLHDRGVRARAPRRSAPRSPRESFRRQRALVRAQGECGPWRPPVRSAWLSECVGTLAAAGEPPMDMCEKGRRATMADTLTSSTDPPRVHPVSPTWLSTWLSDAVCRHMKRALPR